MIPKANIMRVTLILAFLILLIPIFPQVTADSPSHVGDNRQNSSLSYTNTTIPVGDGPAAIDILPSLHQLYVANFGTDCTFGLCTNYSDTVTVINTKTNTVLSTITVGDGPFGVAANPFTNLVYVTNFVDGSISVISGLSLSVVATIPLKAPTLSGVAVNELTNTVYVTNLFGNVVMAFNANNFNLLWEATTGNWPIGVAVNSLSGFVYVTNVNDSTLSMFSRTGKLLHTVQVGLAPTGVAVDPLTGLTYVANSGFWNSSTPSNTVSVVGLDGKVKTTVGVSSGPAGVAVDSKTGQVFVTNFGTFEDLGNTMSMINGRTMHVTATFTTGYGPSEVITNPLDGSVYVLNFADNTVTAFNPIHQIHYDG